MEMKENKKNPNVHSSVPPQPGEPHVTGSASEDVCSCMANYRIMNRDSLYLLTKIDFIVP